MKKLTYNSAVLKKMVWLFICVLLVGLLVYSIVSSYTTTGHIYTNSDASLSTIPTGAYQDYIKLSVDVPSNSLESSDNKIENIINGIENNPDYQYHKTYVRYTSITGVAIEATNPVVEDATNFDLNWPSEQLDIDRYSSYLNGDKGIYVGETGSLTYTIDNVPAKGFYNIIMSYFIPKGKGSVAQRKILVNDKVLFDDLLSVSFARYYKDAEEIKQDINGNDLKPSQAEVYKYHEDMYLSDTTGYIAEPFKILLEEGTNTITFESVKEGMVITDLQVVSLDQYDLPDYNTYYNELISKGAKLNLTPLDASNYLYEAEASNRVSSAPTLYPTTDRTSAGNTPNDPVRTKYNAIGGSKWSTPGDEISWTINVAESGFYKIAFRAKQDLARGMFATRKLLVNGEQPFKEAANLRFYYSSEYQIISLGSKPNEESDVVQPYYVYLEAGENTISLQASLGDYGQAISRVNKVIDKLNSIYLKIIAITTTNPDDYTDYKLTGDNNRLGLDEDGKPIDLKQIFSDCAVELNDVSQYITKLTGEKSSLNNVLDKIVLQMGGYVDFDGDGVKEDVGGFGTNPRNITRDLNAFKTNLSSLGTWILDVQEQSLTIESFYVCPIDTELPNAEEGFFKNAWFSIRGFFLSFFFDYESIGVISEEGFKKEIEVWFLTSETSGREQANVLKNLIDMYFIYENEETENEVDNYKNEDCNVILKVLAQGVLLPATLAGTGPDVAINVGEGLPVNYALRGAIYDLTNQPDYEEVVAERFYEDEMIPMLYKEQYDMETIAKNPELAALDLKDGVADGIHVGAYGLPNTASFLVMFYRKDIFEEHGWKIEDIQTWDDVADLVKELSVLNLGFYLPLEGAGSQIYATLLYQNGGSFYVEDQTECNFSTETAKKAFEQWCSYFCDYGFDMAANFTNRFRSGEMPIGISSYTLYNTLSVFAPDIAGKWDFAPLPGVKTEVNGKTEVVNKGVLGITSNIIMKQKNETPENQWVYDMSWAFLKWWTSDVIQAKYATEIESILGSGARHNTANKNAFEELPWTDAERKILSEQFKNAFGIPEVAGGYYIGRNLENAIREVINNDSNPRETLAEYVELINSEIDRKREEFNLLRKKED